MTIEGVVEAAILATLLYFLARFVWYVWTVIREQHPKR
jgi:hypothetical protein